MGLGQSAEARFQGQVRDLVAETLKEGNLGGTKTDASKEWANPDRFADEPNFREALQKAGVESCNLIVGVDFTRSNLWQGSRTFHGESLHALDSKHGLNPYQCALQAVSSSLKDFDDDGNIPAFIFGDVETKHDKVAALALTEVIPLNGLVDAYRKAASKAQFSGPTSFAPLIDRSIEIVKQSGSQFHVLLILADGCVDDSLHCLQHTREAIVRACAVPLVIVMVGIGDGPWEVMEEFDDGLPERQFDNFQFVPFAKFHELMREVEKVKQQRLIEIAFMVCALQEVPAQYSILKRLALVGNGGPAASASAASGAMVKVLAKRQIGDANEAERDAKRARFVVEDA